VRRETTDVEQLPDDQRGHEEGGGLAPPGERAHEAELEPGAVAEAPRTEVHVPATPVPGAPHEPPRELALSDASRAREVRALIGEGIAAAEPTDQLRLFQRAHARDLNDPLAMSYYGMALATVQHHYQQGIVFCEEAVRRQGPNPDLLVNLAKAYIAAKNKREAVRALRRAMARAQGADERARAELAHLGLRRPPVLPFLPRSFIVNKFLGLMRHRWYYRKLAGDDGGKPIPAELGQLSGDVAAARASLPPPPPEPPSPDEPSGGDLP
jgi:hypothetical protein